MLRFPGASLVLTILPKIYYIYIIGSQCGAGGRYISLALGTMRLDKPLSQRRESALKASVLCIKSVTKSIGKPSKNFKVIEAFQKLTF